MAFDFGFNFRKTAGFVTDPTYASPVLGEAYPYTYTNGDGLTVNGGFSGEVFGTNDRVNSIDPRLAGSNQAGANGVETFFNVDLSSGSAPGAGNYSVDVAWGDPSFGTIQDWRLLDGSTVLIDATNGGAGTTVNAGQYIDATLALVTTTTWNGTPVTKSFATTMCKVGKGFDNLSGANSLIAHFRLTFAGAAGGGGAGACECSYFHSFEYREVSDFMDCVVGRRS